MLSKSLFTVALLGAAANFASATPPACLLGAVNTQSNPSDLDSICGPNASKVQAQIRSICGTNTGTAMSAFSSICSAAGHHVATSKPKASAKKTSVITKSHHSTQSHSKGHSTEKHTVSMHSTKVTKKVSHKTSEHSSKAQQTSKILSTTVARETNTAANAVASGGPNGPSASKGSSSPKAFDGAAGHIDAHGFAELALAAAGLVIFL